MKLSKYHGLGNDFILIDGAAARAGADRAALARQLCDRHRGVGGDGVLWLEQGEEGADARMIVYNADGSRPEMCGNGIRCFALHLERQRGAREVWAIATDAGLRRCRSGVREGAWVTSVEMGAARLDPHPLDLEEGGHRLRLHLASMGNPHAVCVVSTPEASLLELASRLGPALSAHPIFPQGANIEWVRPRSDGALELVVYERGAGLTQACGTGACAAAAVVRRLGLTQEAAELPVDLPGGRLWITFEPDPGAALWMTGPAAHVFDATLQPHPA